MNELVPFEREPKALGTTLCKFDERGRLIIPKDFTVAIAAQMFNELRAVENTAQRAKHELIAACVDRLGRDTARQIAGQFSNSSTNYVDRVISITSNTTEIRQKFPTLGLNQLAALATISDQPAKQHAIAERAVAHDMPAVMVMAAINGTDEETERMRLAVIQLQNILGVIATHEDSILKALNLCKQFVRKHDDKHNHNH